MRIPWRGLALALVAALPGTASAASWQSLAPPQSNWDPIALAYDGSGRVFADVFVNSGPTNVFVRPAGGVFGAGFAPIAGNGAATAGFDDAGNALFAGIRSSSVKFNLRDGAGTLGSETTIGTGGGLVPGLAVSGTGHAIAAWPTSASAGAALNASFRPSGGTFAADTLSSSPTVGTPLLVPFVFAATANDGSGLVVYTDNNSADGILSFIARTSAGIWSTPAAVDSNSGTASVGFASNAAGDALVTWVDGSGNHAKLRPHGGSFTADDPPPAGNLIALALQADGSALGVIGVTSSTSVQLYRRAAGTPGWVAIGSSHQVNASSGTAGAAVAASRTGDKIAYAWTQKPGNTSTDAYRIFAQVGTAADLGGAAELALPNQPAQPGQTAANHNESPTIAVDSAGNAVAVWKAVRGGPASGTVLAAALDVGGGGGGGSPSVDPGPSPPSGSPPGGDPPPVDNSLPTANPVTEDPVERLLGLDGPRTVPVGANGLDVSMYCMPSNRTPCNGALGTVVSGSYRPGGQVFAAASRKLASFSFTLRLVPFSIPPGKRKKVRVKIPKSAQTTERKALHYKSGKVTITLQITLRGRKGKPLSVSVKRR
jgi:hypothetical protein